MLSEDEIQNEINRINNNPYDDIDGVEHVTKFDSDAYVKGLEYALGNHIEQSEFTSKKIIENIVSRIKNELDIDKIQIKREGLPPKYLDVSVHIFVNIENVDEYMEIDDKIKNIARDEENEDELVYTRIRRL